MTETTTALPQATVQDLGGLTVLRGGRGSPVRCLDTGVVYPSVAAAARAHGLDPNGIRQSAVLGCRCQGTRWWFVNDPPPKSGRLPKNLPRSVRCVETGAVYPSLTAAAQAVGTYPSKIRRAARQGQACGDYRWQFVELEAAHG